MCLFFPSFILCHLRNLGVIWEFSIFGQSSWSVLPSACSVSGSCGHFHGTTPGCTASVQWVSGSGSFGSCWLCSKQLLHESNKPDAPQKPWFIPKPTWGRSKVSHKAAYSSWQVNHDRNEASCVMMWSGRIFPDLAVIWERPVPLCSHWHSFSLACYPSLRCSVESPRRLSLRPVLSGDKGSNAVTC